MLISTTPIESFAAKPSGAFRVLATGDAVGKPGRQLLRDGIAPLRKHLDIDFVVANVENCSGGQGPNAKNARELLAIPALDILTTGDHIRDRDEVGVVLEETDRLLRPLNYADLPGTGATIVEVAGLKVGVANMIGKVFLKDYGAPLAVAEECFETMEGADVKLLDVHAEATAEKIAIGFYLDGRVSAVWGTHTHVQTADETILDAGTGFICDLGMVGAHRSVLGRKVEKVIAHMQGLPKSFMEVSKEKPRIDGCLFDIDPESGRCLAAQRLLATPQTYTDVDDL